MIKFYAYGHGNIRATHKTTLEFTKDRSLTKKGDCIVGINSDFELNGVRDFISRIKDSNCSIRITIKANIKNRIIEEEIGCIVNKNFSDSREMVIRKSGYADKRTFAISADKAASDISRAIVDGLKNPGSKIEVLISCINN